MSPEILIPLTFLAGAITECLFLIHKKPAKYSLWVFFGMLIYMIAMNVYSIYTSYIPSAYSIEKILASQIISFSFVFAFLFIAIFLKETLKIINEITIFSITVTFWFLMINNPNYYLVIPGLLGTMIAFILYNQKTKSSNLIKTLAYAWFLLANGFFAYSMYAQTPDTLFYLYSSPANISYLSSFIYGLLTTYLLMNIGVLYYGFIAYVIDPNTRKTVHKNVNLIFTDQQITKREIYSIIIIQIMIFSATGILKPYLNITVIAIWTLLLPIALKLYRTAQHSLVRH